MTDVLASRTHSTWAILVHWEGGDVYHVVVRANFATPIAATLEKTSIWCVCQK